MKKTILPLLITSLIFNSCGEFEQKNLTDGATNTVTGTDTLSVGTLGDLTTINTGTFSVKKMITNIGINVISPLTASFKNNVNELDGRINTYCAVVDTKTEDENVLGILKAELQSTFKETMKSYHRLEAVNYGPLNENGKDLAISIYSWPSAFPCFVDNNLVTLKSTGFDMANIHSNRGLGLDALSALILVKDEGTTCTRRINEELQNWLDNPVTEKRSDRCSYMKILSKDLKEKSDKLYKGWDISKDNYTLSMTRAKTEKELKIVANEISQSFFYLDTDLKDAKIGNTRKACKRLNEHINDPKLAVSSILENINAFQAAFNGIHPETKVNGFGYDDYLRNIGHENIVTNINSNTKVVIDNLENLLNSSGEITKAEICKNYEDVKSITTILKTEFTLALGEDSRPRNSQGDMD